MLAESGTIIHGKYEILAPLGAGGMGSVYRARHVLTEQHVALKVLRVGPGDESLARRFKLEVSVAAKVDHPGIVKVFDAGTEPTQERFYLAMELLQGRSLRDAMAEPGADARAVIGYLADALDVMHAAHAHGVIHRDLKPDNLFLEETPDGPRLRVLDFGIARDVSGPSVTTTGVAVGTALYMAPEQGTASKDIGPPADIWAIGAMLYETLAGRVPFDGPSAHAVVIEAVTMPHVALSQLRPDLAPEWSALVDRCLSKKPAQRPTADELRIALVTLLRDEVTLPGPSAAPAIETGPMAAQPSADQPRAEPLAETVDAVDAVPSRARPLALDEEPIPDPPARSRWWLGALAAAAVAILGLGAWAVSGAREPAAAPLEPEPPAIEARTEAPVQLPAPTPPPSVEEPVAPSPTPAPRLAERPRTTETPAPRAIPAQTVSPEPASVPEEPRPAAGEAPAAPAPVAATPAAEPEPASDPPTPVTQGTSLFEGADAFDRDAPRPRGQR